MKTKQHMLMVLILVSGVLFSSHAFAQTKVLSLIYESQDNEDNYWWKGSTPAFTELDKELASSFQPLPLKLLQPKKSVSRVYRTNELNDEKAQTIASLFGAQIVMHGQLHITPIEEVAGQKGVRAKLRVTLVGKQGTNSQTFVSVFYSDDPTTSRSGAKRVITKQLARFVNWASKEKGSANVGYPLSTMEIFLQNGNAELIGKLREEFVLNKAGMRPIWACESGVAFRVSGVDPKSIQRIVERIESEDIEIEISRRDQGLLVKGKK